MPKITMEEYEEFPVLPQDTIISVRVDEINVRDVPGQRGTWQKAEFKFKILGVPSAEFQKLVGETIYGSVPFRFTESPDNKLRQWVEAIFGMELSAGFELDTDLLLNRECRAIISNYDKKAKDPRTGNPYKGHQVDALLSKGGQGMAAPQAPVQQPQQQFATTAPAAPQDPWAAQGNPYGGTQPQQPVQTQGWGDEPPF